MLLEGADYTNDPSQILKHDFSTDGFCSFNQKFLIVLIPYVQSHQGNDHPIVKHIKKLIANTSTWHDREFPDINTLKGNYLLLKQGMPVDGGSNYQNSVFNTLSEVVSAIKGKLNESLKDKIRTALKEDSVARRNTRWNPDSQPNIYQLDIFLRKSGYRLVDVVDNEGHPEPIIESMKEGHLHPDITYSVADQTFYVQVKKYGELVSSDLEEVIEGYQTALGVVKHLDDLDLSKLEYKESEDEE